jgi:membrane protein implicated in regulation of membrane protease activity
MQDYLIWAIAGFVLIIVELITGTFYLLVLGIAALVAAAVAFFGGNFWVQVLIGGSAALLGTYFVHQWWARHPKTGKSSNDLDRGQTVVLESWVNETNGLARVKYRGTTWDARIEGKAGVNDVLYIQGQENGMLHVSNQPTR